MDEVEIRTKVVALIDAVKNNQSVTAEHLSVELIASFLIDQKRIAAALNALYDTVYYDVDGRGFVRVKSAD